MDLEIKYRRNNKEKYTTCKPKSSYNAFDVITKLLENTDEVEFQVKVLKLRKEPNFKSRK